MAQIPGYWEEYPPTAGGGGGGTGTVTNIATSSPITGGPITTTGTIGLANSGVTLGTYGDATHVAQFTVDAHGLLTFAGNVAITAGSPGAPSKSVQFNNGAGGFGGDGNFLWDSGTTTLTWGSGARITGDFSNATHASRTLFQTSTVNANTIVGFIPNGTSNTASSLWYSNSNPGVAQNVCRVAQSGTVSVLDANVVNAGTQGTLEIRIAAVAALTFDTTKNAQFAAGVQVPVVTKTGNYTLVEGDVCVFADATSASLTLTLPAANIAGAGFTPIIRIKRIDSTAGKTVTVSRAGADTIDGGTSTVLGSLQAVDLISDGVSKWGIV